MSSSGGEKMSMSSTVTKVSSGSGGGQFKVSSGSVAGVVKESNGGGGGDFKVSSGSVAGVIKDNGGGGGFKVSSGSVAAVIKESGGGGDWAGGDFKESGNDESTSGAVKDDKKGL